MNMLSTCIVAMLLFFPLILAQQCRQVTVCNEESSNLMKGDKGDVGSPGKAGPVGSRGPKGEVGGVGEKRNARGVLCFRLLRKYIDDKTCR